MQTKTLALVALLAITVVSRPVRADVDAVKKYLGEATELVGKGSSFFDDASAKLDLAESSMDDVPEAQKAELKAKIEALKSQIAGAANEQEAKILRGKIDRYLHEAENAIGNLVTWKGAAADLNQYLDDPKTTTLLGADEVAKYKKQFATYAKLNGTKALKANLQQAAPAVEDLEKSWAEGKKKMTAADAAPNDTTSALRDAGRDLESIERYFTDLPADNADVKVLRARVDKVKAEVAAAESSAGAADQLAAIDRFLDTYRTNFADMDKETGPASFDEYLTKTNRELKVDATQQYVSRVGEYLTGLEDEENYKAVKDAPAVKAKVAEMTRKVQDGRAKLLAISEKVVSSLEAKKVDGNNKNAIYNLKTQIANAIGYESAESKAFATRIDKLVNDFDNAGVAADAAKVEAYKKMSEAAAKAWPDMMAKFDVTTGFDPNNYKDFKGKLIKIETDNLMGHHFKPGDFPFATTLNGKPVAGNYDPTIAAALAEVEGKIGRGIGDSDDDGKWTVIARVEGTTGTLYQKQEVTGNIQDNGSNVGSWTGTQVTPVESPIVTIVALKAGPVAAAAGQGAVKQDGSVGKPTPGTAAPLAAVGSSGGSGGTANTAAVAHGRGIGSRLFAILTGLFAVVVGGVALMKARFAPLATNAGAVQLTNRLGEGNQALLGFAGIGWGALAVLWSLLAIANAFVAALIGIVAGLAMVVSGVVVSSDAPALQGVVKPDLAAKIKSFAVPAGLTCAALGVVGLLMALVP